MSNHIELFIERVVGLMADRLDERNKANKAKIRAMMIDKGHKAHPYLKGQYNRHHPETGDNIALRNARKANNSKPSPELVAGAAKEKRRRAAEYKFNVGKVK